MVAAGDGSRVERTVAAMTEALMRRGPDHRSHFVRGHVGLGHARLRVVDPTPRADQPMSVGDCHLVFAGAIVNHLALREELAEEGVRFATTGDTEVLLHLLRLRGDAALPRLQGMFAFAFYDERRRHLLLARDRIGIKPLVWARDDDGALLAASEASAIFRASTISRRVDEVALTQLVQFNHPLGSHTFFERVRALEPGCALHVDVERFGCPTPHRWGSVRLAPRPMALPDAIDVLDGAFSRAVARASAVEVPLGCYLSGGVDSGGIAAELARQGRSASCFSLLLDGELSEEAAIGRTAEHVGIDTHHVRLERLSLADLVDYAVRAEMPQWWTSDLALGALARAARLEGTTVVLAGEGPDELFAGYDVYRIAPFRPVFTGLARPLSGLSRLATSIGQRFVPWLPIDASVVDAYLASHDRSRARSVVDHYGFYPENLALWECLLARAPLAPAIRARRATHREAERAHFRASPPSVVPGLSPLERNLQFEISERLPRWILAMGDRMSSAHGLELRFPYLDDAFVDEALTLPMSCRATLRESKRVLRRMHRRRLPSSVAGRRKQALYTPTGAWLGPVLADGDLGRYWSKAVFERAGLLDFRPCEAARARLAAGVRPDALTGMVDEWLFTFALTTSILAVEVCGA